MTASSNVLKLKSILKNHVNTDGVRWEKQWEDKELLPHDPADETVKLYIHPALIFCKISAGFFYAQNDKTILPGMS